MDRKEVEDYIDLMTAKGRKIAEIRKFLLQNGVDQLMLDEIIDEILFNAPTKSELTVEKLKEDQNKDKDIDDILSDLSPEKLDKEEEKNKKSAVNKLKRKKEKKKEAKIVNPRKIRRKRLLVNSILLIILAGAVIAIGTIGIEYYKYYQEKQQKQLIEAAVLRSDYGLTPLKEIVLRKENETLMLKLALMDDDSGS